MAPAGLGVVNVIATYFREHHAGGEFRRALVSPAVDRG